MITLPRNHGERLDVWYRLHELKLGESLPEGFLEKQIEHETNPFLIFATLSFWTSVRYDKVLHG